VQFYFAFLGNAGSKRYNFVFYSVALYAKNYFGYILAALVLCGNGR
jgi:hypothetical protein